MKIHDRRDHGLLLASCLSAMLLAGCGSSSSYEPPEVGWHVDAIEKVQADRAKVNELVIYRYEWASADVLSATGERHLQRIEIALMQGTVPPGAAVTIEPGSDAKLDGDRQGMVARRLRQDAPSIRTAVVAIPRAHGIDGDEAANVDADTPRGGQTNGSNGSSSGGISGGLSGGLGGGLGGGAGLSGGGL